ncbi:MAG: hypothetical protein ACI85I_000976 [Arenicella sp.]|jgi:hypothetical protein
MKFFIPLILFIAFQSESLVARSSFPIQTSVLGLEIAESVDQKQFLAQSIQEKKALKLAYRIQKKLKKKAKKKGIKTNVEFVDVATLAGAIVCILGVISIIFSPIGGLIVAVLGLLIYLIGKSQGGEINKIIQAIEDEA